MNTNANSSTTNKWLKGAAKKLERTGIATARLDALILLEDVLGIDRSRILADGERKLGEKELALLEQRLLRRMKHEPLAYIRKKTEFYGREFLVNKHTLEPRPESETMIDMFKELIDSGQLAVDGQLHIADIGTGSGCLAITVKLEFPEVKVIATDISTECLRVAAKNAQHLVANVEFMQGDLLEPLLAVNYQLSAILCNLPYVPDSHVINQAAMHEPTLAIFGGKDGLDLYRKLFNQINDQESKPIYVLTESLPFQHKELATIAERSGYKQVAEHDFIKAFQQVS